MSEENSEELQRANDKNKKLMGEAKASRDKIRALEDAVKRFDGIDPDAFKSMQADSEKRKQTDLESAGKWDEAKSEMERQHNAQLEAANKSVGEWRNRFEDRAINSELLSEANKGNAINADQVAALLRGSVKLSDTGAVEVIGSDGKPVLDDKGNAETVVGYVTSFLADNPHFVRASGGGAGSSSGTGAGAANTNMTSTQKIAAGLS